MGPEIIGIWSGQTPAGEVVRFNFRDDGTMVWTVESCDSPGDIMAKFSLDAAADPPAIDIFDFDMPELNGYRFLGIYRHEAENVLRLFGQPMGSDDLTPRPTEFSEEAIVLRRQFEGPTTE